MSVPTGVFGSECMRVPVYMYELNLLRATSTWIHVPVSVLMNVFPARHTCVRVCVCALGHLFVCVRMHVYVFACALEYFRLLGLPCIGGAQLVSSSEHFQLGSGSVFYRFVCVSACSGVVSAPWASECRVRQPFRGFLFWF